MYLESLWSFLFPYSSWLLYCPRKAEWQNYYSMEFNLMDHTYSFLATTILSNKKFEPHFNKIKNSHLNLGFCLPLKNSKSWGSETSFLHSNTHWEHRATRSWANPLKYFPLPPPWAFEFESGKFLRILIFPLLTGWILYKLSVRHYPQLYSWDNNNLLIIVNNKWNNFYKTF